MKKEINIFDYAREITSALPGGLLLTAKSGDRVNSMTIGWGHLGVIWQKPFFVAYVREGRFTRPMLDESREFTLNIPLGSEQKKILAFCGTRSGKDVNKAEQLGLTLVDSDLVKAPGIKELPLTVECKIMYSQLLDKNAIPADILERMYPADLDSTHTGCNRDLHVAYYGQIVKAYIIED